MAERVLKWNKYNPRQFESICARYLKEIYNPKEYRIELTSEIKDGGNDIIIIDLKKQIQEWAECKHHSKNINLAIIGKNIVLAVSDPQPKKLIFFSVTDIVMNTKFEILEAAELSGFKVEFLDGDKLDLAFLRNTPTLVKKYFSVESFEKFATEVIRIETGISAYPKLENYSNSMKKEIINLNQGPKFYVFILLKNVSNISVTEISIEIMGSPDIRMKKNNIRIETLSKYTDRIVILDGQTFSRKEEIYVPDIKLSYICDEKKYSKKIKLPALNASYPSNIEIIGDKVIRFISTFNEKNANDFSNEHYMRVLVVYGKKGSGKTKIVYELKQNCESNLRETSIIDCKKKNLQFIVKKLISNLFDIPVNMKGTTDDYNKILKKVVGKNKLDIDTEFIAKLLNETIDLTKIKNQNAIIKIIDEGFKQKNTDIFPICFILENFNCYNPDISSFFRLFFDYFKNTQENILFIISIADDQYNSNFLNIEMIIKNGNKNYYEYKIADFTSDETRIMIEKCFGEISLENHKKLKYITENIGNLPEEIMAFCSKCMGSNNYQGSLASITKEEINKYLQKTDIDFIINELNYYKGEKKELIFILQALLFFENEMLEEWVIQLEIIPEKMDILLDKLIIKIDNSIISLRDDNLKTILDKEDIYILSNEEIMRIYQIIEDGEIILDENDYIFYKLKCMSYINEKTEYIAYGIEKINYFLELRDSITVHRLTEFLYNDKKVISEHKEYFWIGLKYATSLIETVNFTEGVEVMENLKEDLQRYRSILNPSDINQFYHRLANMFSHSGNYLKAIEILQEFKGIQPQDIYYQFIIFDRLCVSYSSIGKFDESIIAIDKAIAIAQLKNENQWLSIAYSDKAFTYLKNTYNYSKAITNFEKAVLFFEEKQVNDISRHLEILIQDTLIEILKKDFKVALIKGNIAHQTCEEKKYDYLVLSALNLQAMVYMELHEYEKAEKILCDALERATNFNEKKNLVILNNSLGVLFGVQEEHELALNYFAKAVEILNLISSKTYPEKFSGVIVNYHKIAPCVEILEKVSKKAKDFISESTNETKPYTILNIKQFSIIY